MLIMRNITINTSYIRTQERLNICLKSKLVISTIRFVANPYHSLSDNKSIPHTLMRSIIFSSFVCHTRVPDNIMCCYCFFEGT